ncbi:2'-5' RNA ligase family protein [Bradyrhizobium sp. 83002]|uniref:2'-5' RNA ligase family protein n=1 Tax=Bradyrhizobium aeschynomenes TaxID=2734909 RepID=UPI0015575BD7|nr:2'-5' RNA ligase family protein [Bradyrhizobium aeschynomenes]NPU15080.1 2'-5' RNA ligase family protein [Bradyrhizobium aeschynomenes]NPV21214.1 2'-5' RNA ligase family protein [Bradyrhizobium aeschynomenes]
MAIALNIRSDHVSAGYIERLWDQVAAFEDEPSMRGLGYRPHFTLAIYDAPEIDVETASRVMRAAVEAAPALQLEFNRINWFSTPRFVLWAEPEMNEGLLKWHAAIAAAIDPALCRQHYRPSVWVPHCTLGTRILDARRDDAMAFARSFDRRLTVVFDVIDCVVFPPVRIVAEQRLARAIGHAQA